MVKSGYILFLTMIMLAMGTAFITQIFYTGNVYNSYVALTLDKERARQLALGGVSVAMSQLMLLDKKLSPPPDKEKKEEKKNIDERVENQKKLLEIMLQVQNKWQTFILKHETDEIDAELKICISCENGKIDCNQLYNYEINKFISSRGQNTEELYKQIGEKLKPFLDNKNIAELITSFIKTQKRPLLTVTEFLKNKKLAQIFENRIFYFPHEQKQRDIDIKLAPEKVYLTDIFTVDGESFLSMWSLSPSLQKIFGLYSERNIASDQAKEIIKKASEVKNMDELGRALEIIYGMKNNALPKEFLSYIDLKFEPRLFSVLCYAKVGRVSQKLIALVEKAPMKDGEIIKMKKIYWI